MSEHITSPKVYVAIWALLMVLTVVTIAVAFVQLGPLNDAVALTIAVIKATFVILYFMHVRNSTPLTKLVVVSGFLFLILLVGITLSDVLTREFLDSPGPF